SPSTPLPQRAAASPRKGQQPTAARPSPARSPVPARKDPAMNTVPSASARLLAASLLIVGAHAAAQAPIKIGEINSYKALPQNLVPYKQGWLLAQEEVNAAGGVLGRKLETVFRD